MLKSLQFLLVALMILALPLRGYAAATMQLCQTTGHGVEAEGAHAVHAHEHDARAPEHGDARAGHGSDVQDAHGSSTCSACGACCSGASATASSPMIPAIKPVSAIAVLPAQEFSGVVLENPERPPLSIVR